MAEHDHSAIKEDMNVIGADGVHIGTVDHLDGERIKLTKADSVDGKHHYLPAGSQVRPAPPVRGHLPRREGSPRLVRFSASRPRRSCAPESRRATAW